MSEIECAYCGCDVTAHDPVEVREWDGDGGSSDGPANDRADGDEVEIPFCNYGCLAAHVEERGLALGTTCSL